MVWGIFVLASADVAWKTGVLLDVVGLSSLIAGLLAFNFAKASWALAASIALAAAICIEAFEILMLLFVDLLLGRESAIILGAGHGLPVVVFIVFYAVMYKAQARIVNEINKRIQLDTKAHAFLAEKGTDAERVTSRAQALVRGHRARKVAIRRRELQAWTQLTLERRVMAVLVYSILFIVIGFCTYINLLYGVTFSPSQSRAWVLASLTSFISDALINTPMVMFGKTVVFFVRRVLLTSLDSVVMGKITMDAINNKRGAVQPDKTRILGDVLTTHDPIE